MTVGNTDFATLRKIFFGIGCAGLTVSAFMTWEFGASMSLKHGISLVLVTLAAAFLFPAARLIRDMGSRHLAAVLTVAGVMAVSLEFMSHLGYTTSQQSRNMTEGRTSNANWAAAQESRDSEKLNLEMWRKQLASLKEQNAWLPTVTASGLRAQLESADKAIELETARGGCKARCLALMKDKGKLEERIAAAEQVDDLGKRIEATQRVLDRKTETFVTTKQKPSSVHAQLEFAPQLINLWTAEDEGQLKPSSHQMTGTKLLMGTLIALGATGLPTIAFMIAFFGVGARKHEDDVQLKPTANVPATIDPLRALATFSTRYHAECAKRGVAPIQVAA